MNNEQWTSPRRLVIVCCPSSYEQYTILETIQATVHSIKFAYVSARNRPLSQFLFPRRFSGIFYVQTNKHGLSGLFSTLLAIQIGPETILQVEGFLMVVEWNLVYFCVKICSLGGISTSGIFDIFAWISTTKGVRNKWRLQRDSAHQTGSETPWVASLIIGWWCFIDGWQYRPEFFTLEYLCLSLNSQNNHWQTDGTGEFSASKRSNSNLPWCADFSLLMLYKGVKFQLSLGGIFMSRVFMFWLVAQEPKDVWTNGCHRRIWRIKLV